MPRARAASATRRSCVGSTNENSRQTASASVRLRSTRSSTADKAASSSCSTTLPSAATRSRTSNRRASGTSGGGLLGCSAYSTGRSWRPMASVSRKPSVVMRAVRAPRRVSRAFVATVDPWTTSSGCQPASRIPASTARSGSRGVLGRFAMSSRSPSQKRKSVKVPPTSTPSSRRPRRDATASARRAGSPSGPSASHPPPGASGGCPTDPRGSPRGSR